jgi:uncharacterized protein (TIGR03790 family)
VLIRLLILCSMLLPWAARGEGLGRDSLGVIYNRDDRASTELAHYYVRRRGVPEANLIGLSVPDRSHISREELKRLRTDMLANLPTTVQSLLLVWSRPYAVECMSVTTAFAAGYNGEFCEPGCGITAESPLYDSGGWLPADTAGWFPAMLLPSADPALAKAIIERGIAADGSRPAGTAYLVTTQDAARNVRAALYADAVQRLKRRLDVIEVQAPITAARSDILAYFTGASRVEELPNLRFRPGAAADHLTSWGGQLEGSTQMSALEWLRQGATATYGSVSEPCNHLEKFPNPAVFLDRYVRGETVLEAYWKSVRMPGQGLFIGEPLARPYGSLQE